MSWLRPDAERLRRSARTVVDLSLRELAEARLLGERSGFLADAFECREYHKKKGELGPQACSPRLVVQLFPLVCARFR